MTAGFAGLLLWSFLMATARGAGLMLVPALIPLCMGSRMIDQGSLWTAVAAVSVHTLATRLVTGAIAVIVYEWLGLEFLHRSWINFDALWCLALVATGGVLVLA
jgi:hypothetical protein